ncbi:MAG: hypothetical protein D4R79_14950 [Comamonadaceae bacterium]|nr:MAG: hypothetical protein D4R79_14950 [Comamonadaceae bacterium]
MSNEVKFQAVLKDVLHILVDRAASKAGALSQYDQGVRMGNFEAVSTILNEIETFGIDPADVGMKGFDPMSMLRNPRKAA